jgi:hypothetical protein
MQHKAFDFPASCFFHEVQDPADMSFRLIQLRIPHNPEQTPFGPFDHRGIDARDRLARFCAGYLAGLGHLTTREAEKIIKKHPRKD